jgi:formate hydrogenlyase transcriptional activator
VGSNRTIKVNVRIIAATNRDLEAAVRSGVFRSDLYYRLNVIPLTVPALRDRRSDIPEMVMAFLQLSAARMGKPIHSVSRETMRLLVDCPWPGNIRELQNVIERGVVLSRGSVLRLGADLLPVEESHSNIEPEATPEPTSTDSLENVQRQHILRVLERTRGLVSGPNGAGAVLNLHPNTLRSLMDRLGIRHAARHSATADEVLSNARMLPRELSHSL